MTLLHTITTTLTTTCQQNRSDMVITGTAGTGQSYLINALAELLADTSISSQERQVW